MQIKGLAHIAFNVADMDRSLDFYCNKLGMRQVFSMTYADLIRYCDSMAQQADKQPGDQTQEIMWKQIKAQLADKKDRLWMTYLEFAPGQFIELFTTDPGTPMGDKNKQKVGYQHFCLEVEDIQRAKQELLAAGVTIIHDASLAVDNTWQLWVADPDGNEFELHQYTPTSLQLL